MVEAIFDATVVFCRRFLAHDRRTTDQTVQAARNGVQNISESSGAAATSRKSEMLLTNVARASLNDELLPDYETFLRQNGMRVWSKDSRPALAMRERLRHDHVANLPAAPPDTVRLTGLGGLADFVGKSGRGNRRQRNDMRDPSSRVPSETPNRKPRPPIHARRRILGENVPPTAKDPPETEVGQVGQVGHV